MKKLFKFLLYFILFVLVVLFTAPILFKGKIVQIANEQINNNINAKANFDDIKLSFFRRFPYLSVEIQDLSVTGINDFEGDTLLYLKSFNLAVDVISAIKMENIEIKKIAIDQPIIHGIILESGKANWDIAKETETPEPQPEDTTATEFNAKIALKSFSIKNANISYDDIPGGMSANLDNFNFELSGDLGQAQSALVINSNTDRLNFVMEGIRYLKDVALNIHIDIDANLQKNIFILQQNSFALNDFVLNLDGSVEMPDSADMLFDLAYSTGNTDFKTLLSLIPAIYMTDFSGLKTTGSLALKGNIKGSLGEDHTPDVDGNLIVKNATFSYPDLPKTAKNINIDLAYFYDGKQMDNTTLDVNKFHVELGNNPVDIILNLKTPISDPYVNSQIKANLDLASIMEIIPLENTQLTGKIMANLDVMGNISVLENEEYEKFKADGSINIQNLYYNSPDVPKPVSIPVADLKFSPKYLYVEQFKTKIGKSDFALNGKVTDFLPYAMNDETIHGQFSFTAGTIDLNEFMSGETEETAVEETDSSTIVAVEIPANIDFELNSSINKLYYDKLEIDQVTGKIIIRDSKVNMEKLNMHTLDGTLTVSGAYDSKDIKNPLVDLDVDANSIDIGQAFAAFGVLKKIAPIASKATGKVSLGMNYSSFLDDKMKPKLKSIVGAGFLTSNNIKVNGSDAFAAIGNQLKTDAFKEFILNDVNLDYEIRSGRVLVSPFETKLGPANLTIGGDQGFDNTLDYGINIMAPKSLFGGANNAISNLYSNAAIPGFDLNKSDNVNLLVKLTGNMKDPKVKIDAKNTVKSATESVKQELKNNAEQVIETHKDEAKEKARAEADKILKEAEKQAAEVKKQGKIAADKIREGSKTEAEKLVKEASNPIAKKAAELSAKKIVAEGEKRAKQVENESDSKAQKIMEVAHQKADRLLK
jgi:hypothetical protein